VGDNHLFSIACGMANSDEVAAEVSFHGGVFADGFLACDVGIGDGDSKSVEAFSVACSCLSFRTLNSFSLFGGRRRLSRAVFLTTFVLVFFRSFCCS